MKTKILAISGVFVLLLVMTFTGCSALTAQAGDTQPIKVNVNTQEGIWVSGTGKIPVAPDLAILNLGVNVEMTSVAEAQAKASAAMDKVMQVLTSKGIAKADIQTQYFNIYQVTRWDDKVQQSKPTGYNVSNMLTVKIRDLTSVSSVIDAVIEAGGNDIRFNGINFSVEKPEKYYVQAREEAMKDAKANAEKLAALAGVTLGKVTYVVESTGGSNYYTYAGGNSGVRPAIAANEVSTPISVGQNEVAVSVTVAYEIQ